MLARWAGGQRAGLTISGTQVDISRQSNGDMSLLLEVRVDEAPTAPVSLAMSDGGTPSAVDITAALRAAQGRGWTTIPVRLSCFAAGGTNMGAVNSPLQLFTAGRLSLAIGGVRLATSDGPPSCPAAPQ